MCMTKEYINEFQTIVDNAENQFKTLTKLLQTYEKKQQDILHKIENTKFNACEGFKLAKDLHNLRVERRNIKNELDKLTILKNSASNFNKIITNKIDTINKKQDNPIYFERCKHEVKTLDQVCEKTVNIQQSFNEMMKKFKKDNYMKRKHKWG